MNMRRTEESMSTYCIRNTDGEYLTHALDIQHGTSRVFFTPSPWMAYLTDDRPMADTLARCEGGTVAEWKKPEVKRMK